MDTDRQHDDELADGSSYREGTHPGGSTEADGSSYREQGRDEDEHPLEADASDPAGVVGEMQESAAGREPTGQTGSATEQYGGAGSSGEHEPVLEDDEPAPA
jgi:hypothetical protein